MRALLTAAVLTSAVSACHDGEPAGTGASTKGGPPGDVTIRLGPGGKSQVDGAPLRGDPKVCAAFKSCCTAPDLGLFCGMTQAANNGDCAKSLKEVKAYAREAHVSTPAGCR